MSPREPLSAADAAWLRMEQPNNPMTINAVITFSEPFTYTDLEQIVKERLLLFRRFRQRVVYIAGRPYWEDDPDFDLSLHLHRRGLPSPADEHSLQETIGDLMSQRLDFSKPLWEMYLFENYQAGTALLIRIHHCVADGIALVHAFLSIIDEHIESTQHALAIRPADLLDNLLTLTGLTFLKPAIKVAGELTALSEKGIELLLATLINPEHIQQILTEGSETLQVLQKLLLLPPDPPTPLKNPLSGKRQVTWSPPIPETRIRQLKKAIHQKAQLTPTANDIILSAITGAFRAYLLAHGQSCAHLEVKATLPINLRPLHEAYKLGNEFGLLFLPLPLYLSDPLLRLSTIHEEMNRLKHSKEGEIAFRILQTLGYLPTETQKKAIQFFSEKASMVISNVPGPRRQVHLAGKPIDTMIFWVPQSGSIGIGISIMSYNQHIRVGISSDTRCLPAPEKVLTFFEQEMNQLFNLFLPQTTPQPDSPSTNA